MSGSHRTPTELGSPFKSPDWASMLTWSTPPLDFSFKDANQSTPTTESKGNAAVSADKDLSATPELATVETFGDQTIDPSLLNLQPGASPVFGYSNCASSYNPSSALNDPPRNNSSWTDLPVIGQDFPDFNPKSVITSAETSIDPLTFFPTGPFCYAPHQSPQQLNHLGGDAQNPLFPYAESGPTYTNKYQLSGNSHRSYQINLAQQSAATNWYAPPTTSSKFFETLQESQMPGFFQIVPRDQHAPTVTSGKYIEMPPEPQSSSLSQGESETTPNLNDTEPRARNKKYRAEMPKPDSEHSWLRINGNTLGRSTRTGKINSYNPQRDGRYNETKHPVGDWSAPSGLDLDYTRNGELRKLTFSPEEMQEFLWNHPLAKRNQHGCLTLWIQKTPADSGRRYPTVGSSKCRFEDCPAQLFSRSIGVGLFRVAIDEQWETYGEERDPFHVAGYVHLYCLERFCDFRALCQHLNVAADHRDRMKGEPRQRFSAALSQTQASIAADFVKSCVQGRMNSRYPGYPAHNEHTPTLAKKHKGTLTYLLTVEKNQSTNHSKKLMMQARGLKQSNILVHKGDLQMAVDARKKENIVRRKALMNARHTELMEDEEQSADDESDEEEYIRRPTRYQRTAALGGNANEFRYQDSAESTGLAATYASRKRSVIGSDGDGLGISLSDDCNPRPKRKCLNPENDPSIRTSSEAFPESPTNFNQAVVNNEGLKPASSKHKHEMPVFF